MHGQTWAHWGTTVWQAYFLTPAERTWLHKRQSVAAAEAAKSGAGTISLAAIKDLRTWHLSAISLLANIPKWGIIFFCPLIIDYMLGELLMHGGCASATLPS